MAKVQADDCHSLVQSDDPAQGAKVSVFRPLSPALALCVCFSFYGLTSPTVEKTVSFCCPRKFFVWMDMTSGTFRSDPGPARLADFLQGWNVWIGHTFLFCYVTPHFNVSIVQF